jgi:hypothetical protein
MPKKLKPAARASAKAHPRASVMPHPRGTATPAESVSSELTPEYVEVLRELVEAFGRIPQRYCLLCRAKTRLGIESHRPDCALRRASMLINQKTQSFLH